MSSRRGVGWGVLILWLTTIWLEASRLPNLVILFADDLGYGDLSCYGASQIRTPNLDRMAVEGVRFTDFYVAQAVCSASRAALLTGCYPHRIGIHGALGPGSRIGLAASEVTLAGLLKQRGYATGIFGKWHLGDHRDFLPLQRGFDEFLGLPYSNDMWPFHPEAKPGTYPDLPLIRGNEVIELNPDQSQFTRLFTESAVRFIERNRERPFFLYVPYPMPHVPIFASAPFRGRSAGGLYGDVIEEIDASAGTILETLRRVGVDSQTLMVFLSDNGPWLSYGNHAGSAGPLREGKGTSWEGGVRVPCIARWPGRIPQGTICREPAMTIDLFSTVARLVGAELPAHGVDGRDIWPLLSGQPGATSPHAAYFFYFHQGALEAMRSGRWKLQLPREYRTLEGREGGRDGKPVRYSQRRTALALYDLETDPAESRDLSAEQPEVMQRLLALVEQARTELGDAPTGRAGTKVRPAGRVERP
jgi:arylsulfatase A